MSSSFLRSLQQTKVQCHQSSPWSTNKFMEHFQSINEGLLTGVPVLPAPQKVPVEHFYSTGSIAFL